MSRRGALLFAAMCVLHGSRLPRLLRADHRGGPVRPTVITYVNPAIAAVLGVVVLGEHLSAGMLLGFALVLTGCVLATGRGLEAVAEP